MHAVETKSFPLDWDEWQSEWNQYRAAMDQRWTKTTKFRGKNFLADEVLGAWKVNGRTVELSTGTFPNFSERDERGNLKHYDRRFIGVTLGIGVNAESGPVIYSFAELTEWLDSQ